MDDQPQIILKTTESLTQGKALPVEESIVRKGSNVPSEGRHSSLKYIARQLTEEDLNSSGVQKLIIEMLEKAEEDCLSYKKYMDSFHESDKMVAVLKEKLNKIRALDIIVGLCGTLGGALLGFIPYFINISKALGIISGIFGGLLIIGALIGRFFKE